MDIVDVKFDSGKGDFNVSLSGGVVVLKEKDTNPLAQSSAAVNVPIADIFDAIEKKANNTWVTWGLGFVLWILKKIN